MPTLVSTGQITIVDNNDAKPITSFLTGNIATNQMYSKDESTVSFAPDYTVTNLTLTPKVYVPISGVPTEVTAQLTNRKWSNDLVTSLANGVNYVVNTNGGTTGAAMIRTFYFEGDYTDPVSGLMSHIVCSIVLNVISLGTNAVFLQVGGINAIVQSDSATKNSAILKADLMRSSGVDDTGVSYQWYEMPANTPINQASISSFATKYGFRTTAQANAGSGSALGSNVPAGAVYADVKGIIIGEPAVNKLGLYRVEAKDSDGKVYQAYFSVYDVTDPYSTRMISTAGDKLQNGVGSTNIYPQIYNGESLVGDTTGWSFMWSFTDSVGNKGGFIDTTRTALAGGRRINSNTTGAAATIGFDGGAITWANNDMVKVVSPTGVVSYYEISTVGASSTVTLRVPATTISPLTASAPSVANGLVEGRIYACTGNGVTAGTRTTSGGSSLTAAQIVVTGDEIDSKGTITCQATRP